MNKLYRNDYDKTIAGVCSGMADYFQLDKSLVRIIAVFLLLLFGWITFTTYVVAWVILPIKKF